MMSIYFLFFIRFNPRLCGLENRWWKKFRPTDKMNSNNQLLRCEQKKLLSDFKREINWCAYQCKTTQTVANLSDIAWTRWQCGLSLSSNQLHFSIGSNQIVFMPSDENGEPFPMIPTDKMEIYELNLGSFQTERMLCQMT